MTLAISLVFVLIGLVGIANYLSFIKHHKEEIQAYKRQMEAYRNLVPEPGLTVPMSHFREIVDGLKDSLAKTHQTAVKLDKELSELKSQQQSKSIRLGQIGENVLPFHSEFKYDVKNLVPVFRPVDYLVFNEDEIVFLEIKTGKSQLSEKQKNIRRLIEEKRVRFEEHRVDENGYKIKI